MMLVDEAEARGDALAALDTMEAFATGPDGKYFWRLERAKYLMQLHLLRSVVPAWGIARWLCNQAMHGLVEGNRDRTRRALETAVELRGGTAALPGRDDADAHGRVVDRDWVYRQVFLYELGGLEHFLRHVPSSALLAAAGPVHDWTRSRMGAFRLVDSTSDTVTWLDLTTGVDCVTPNIGSAVVTEPGEHVIGRLVPTSEGAELFETLPMHVPESLAADVAADPVGWIDALRRGRRNDSGWEDRFYFSYEPVLLSDVPSLVWQVALLPSEEVPAEPESDAELARAVLDAAARRLARDPIERRAGELDIWPCLGAALLDPSVIVGLAGASRPSDAPLLERLSGLLAEPAATACRDLAREISEAA